MLAYCLRQITPPGAAARPSRDESARVGMWGGLPTVANLFVMCAGRTGVGMEVAVCRDVGQTIGFCRLSSVAWPALDPVPRKTDHIRRWSVPRLSRVRQTVNRPSA